jgi:ATP-binding cassette subfamily F protein 3
MSVLLKVEYLHKSYADRILFDGLNLTIGARQHIAVIGRNGAGKSTLIRCIMGLESYEAGEVYIPNTTHIGYLRQEDTLHADDRSVLDYLTETTNEPEWECARVASQFAFDANMLQKPVTSYSGGYQMRIKLIALLLHKPNLLLLDEPTNFLDLSTILLLEQFLRSYDGSFLLISHDREFLRKTCLQTIHIGGGRAEFFDGDLDTYIKTKAEEQEFAKKHNKKLAREEAHLQAFVDRFRYKASKASQAQSKLKQLEKLQLERMQLEGPESDARITIPRIEDRKGVAVSTFELEIGYPGKTIASGITFDIERGERIAILGDNGQGKTTLLKTLAGVLTPLSGSYRTGVQMSVGYYAQHVPQMLAPTDQVFSYLEHKAAPGLKKEDVLRMAGNFLFFEHDLKKSVSVLSGGEKARLCLAGILLERHHMLMLDEPTNHLDVETVEALGTALAESNVTVLLVSHDRSFVSRVATSVIEVAGGTIKRYHHDYDNYLYHLKKRLHIGEQTVAVHIQTEKELSREERIIRKERRKKLETAMREVEETISDLERERQKIHDWFVAHPGEFDERRTMRLNSIAAALEEAEREWERVGSEMEKFG